MPQIIAKQIAEQLKRSQSDEEMRQTLASAIGTTRDTGFSGETTLILEEVCEQLREIAERESENREAAERALAAARAWRQESDR